MVIGVGTTTRFADATQTLFGWQTHLRSGRRVATASARARHDAVVMFGGMTQRLPHRQVGASPSKTTELFARVST
jgi:uncharacterized protein (UPF0548 family)